MEVDGLNVSGVPCLTFLVGVLLLRGVRFLDADPGVL